MRDDPTTIRAASRPWLLELIALGIIASGACLDSPDYEGRQCGSAGECPVPFLCGRDMRCHAQLSPEGPSDGGLDLLEVSSPDAAAPDAAATDAAAAGASSAPELTPLCSKEGRVAASFQLVNHCPAKVTPFWVDYACNEVPYSTVAPGGRFSLRSFETHVWRIRDTATGALIREARPLEGPTELIACRQLLHRYSFDRDGTDSIGSAPAELMSGAIVQNGALVLDGVDDYASLPIGRTLSTLDSATVEVWATWSGPDSQPWSRIFDFGTSQATDAFLTPRSAAGVARLAVVARGLTPDELLDAPVLTALGVLTHYAVTFDALSGVTTLYVNGQLAARLLDARLTFARLGRGANDWLGRSQFPSDPYFAGSIAELRIYRDALTPEEIAGSARLGPDTLPQLP